MGKKSKNKNKIKRKEQRANASSESRVTRLPSHNNGTPLPLATVPTTTNTGTTTLLIQALQCGTGCTHGATAADLGSIAYISAFVEDFCPERDPFSTYVKIYDAVKKDGLEKIPPDTIKAMFAIGTNLFLSRQTVSSIPAIVTIASLIAELKCFQSDENAFVHANYKLRYKVETLYKLVAFYAKRIPCHCLDEIMAVYKADYSKTGFCQNCKQLFPDTQLFECAQCRLSAYCSKTCQREHWPEHKVVCHVLHQFKNNQQTMTP